MKRVIQLATILSATAAVPAYAHSEHSSVMQGLVHIFTEPDHLLFSALAAAVLIYAVRKVAAKRS